MNQNVTLLQLNREIVLNDYVSAERNNQEMFSLGNVHTGSSYIYENQKEDAFRIVDYFRNDNIRVVSILKRTKVGMDGLMIEISKLIATHSDDEFVLNRKHIFIITGMSNASWEQDMKDKTPACFRENIFHHGQLHRLKDKLLHIHNALIIIDEIDCGDKEEQKLHQLLRESGLLDLRYMETNNIRFVFVSATIVNELRDLYRWGEKHVCYKMTIPLSYIGHDEFLDRGIIQVFYAVKDHQSADRWIREDILQHYGSDYRVHFIRTDEKHKHFVQSACARCHILCLNHTSDDRISNEELLRIFETEQETHIVILVKGLLRRANYIPNAWKMKMGAMMEKYVHSYDTNVQIQGFPGRMTGYWRSAIENGHKTGPYRTSIPAVREYEEFYASPTSRHSEYSTTSGTNLFVNPRNVSYLEVVAEEERRSITAELIFREFDTQEQAKNFYRAELKPLIGGHGPGMITMEEDGWYRTSVRSQKRVYSCDEIRRTKQGLNARKKFRMYPCYENVHDPSTLKWIFIYHL